MSKCDTVDRRQIWHTLEKTAPAALINLLWNLFDEIQIEMLLNNATSTRFSPVTGVLQGSILSPFLYSIYINELPRLLRPQPTTADIFLTELILRLNCLLYADDVVLIAAKADMPSLLKSCEDHNPTQPSSSYTLYGEPISKQSSFPYLGIPFRPGDYLNTVALVNQNKAKALATMNQLSAIGVHPKDFSPLLSTRFYSHIGRAQLEYGLAITKITTFLSKQLEDAQNVCLRWIFGGSHTTSTAVMLHMSKLPTMQERTYALQSQFLLRSLTLPEDALLHHLLRHIRQPRSHSQCRYNKTTVKATSIINVPRMPPFSFNTAAQLSLSTLSYGYLCPSLKEVVAYVGVLAGSLVVDTKTALDTLANPSQKPIPFIVSRCTVDS
ncbi:hypothetical protein G6F18_011706 [Rhizopus arrhizus]|nr:hypothetical protein G6F18_011706 [Rhizopus arrhizus]KAG1219831.1 hypothetical protein G6F35_007164 [Rhizopus arrhizus]